MRTAHATTPISRLLSIGESPTAASAIGPSYVDTKRGYDDRAMDGWYTLPQARAYLVVGPGLLRSLVVKGLIRSFTPSWNPKLRLYSRDDCRKLLADSARAAGMSSGCVNQSLPRPDNEEKSKPKSKRRGKQIE